MDAKVFRKLVEKVKEDPKFFHELVFNTEKVIVDLDFLDRKAKAAMVAISPERIIATITGEVSGCDVTCTSSCGATCGQSCGYTTNMDPNIVVENPAMKSFKRYVY